MQEIQTQETASAQVRQGLRLLLLCVWEFHLRSMLLVVQRIAVLPFYIVKYGDHLRDDQYHKLVSHHMIVSLYQSRSYLPQHA